MSHVQVAALLKILLGSPSGWSPSLQGHTSALEPHHPFLAPALIPGRLLLQKAPALFSPYLLFTRSPAGRGKRVETPAALAKLRAPP